ncbi:hypothetical protein TUM12370_25990 [Salmonella enterica subsp. enterica serovar Choleraesuis]|nr:hypothetical protein TUM12370_25990 [Salmonella enterica subsp. enterica serovar Choleraesuis]
MEYGILFIVAASLITGVLFIIIPNPQNNNKTRAQKELNALLSQINEIHEDTIQYTSNILLKLRFQTPCPPRHPDSTFNERSQIIKKIHSIKNISHAPDVLALEQIENDLIEIFSHKTKLDKKLAPYYKVNEIDTAAYMFVRREVLNKLTIISASFITVKKNLHDLIQKYK